MDFHQDMTKSKKPATIVHQVSNMVVVETHPPDSTNQPLSLTFAQYQQLLNILKTAAPQAVPIESSSEQAGIICSATHTSYISSDS